MVFPPLPMFNCANYTCVDAVQMHLQLDANM